ncbi:MAG: ATP-dependent nuclease [Rhodobacterales bacterium]
MAEIKITIDNGVCLLIYISNEDQVKAFVEGHSIQPRSISQFKKLFPLDLVVVPTLGPVEIDEIYVQDATVKTTENTRSAHRHFRNIVYRLPKVDFELFQTSVETAWPEIKLEKPSIVGFSRIMAMNFYEKRIPREIGKSGFGFQVWMQMMLHLQRGGNESVLVLDEPDIYLHPTLQKRLVKIVSERFPQSFIATHSTEIINEASSSNILIISDRRTFAKRVSGSEGYSEIFKYLGSSENAEFARLARARRIVFFEGDDKKILAKFSSKALGESVLSDPDTMYLKAGGFSRWTKVEEVHDTLKTVLGLDVSIVSLFDRDYRSEEEIVNFEAEVSKSSLKIRVLKRKEIENYLLVLPTLKRYICKRAKDRGFEVNELTAEQLLIEISEVFRVVVLSQRQAYATSYSDKREKSIASASINMRTNSRFDEKWSTLEGRLEIVPGKQFLTELSASLEKSYGASVTTSSLINEMRKEEIPEEIVEVLSFLANELQA